MRSPRLIPVKIGISLLAFMIAVLHVMRPEMSIDTIVVTLFVIAIFPWLIPLFRSIEFPGGIKVELKDLEMVEARADEAGMLKKTKRKVKAYAFQTVSETDPNLALAGLRIEVEKNLRGIAHKNKIKEKGANLHSLITKLVNNDVVSSEEGIVLQDLTRLLDRAVHGAEVDDDASMWAMTVGIQILEALEAKN
jgi:hypothetical protein